MGLFSRKRRRPAPVPSQSEPARAPAHAATAVDQELIAALRPFVARPETLPAGTADGAPAILPGLVVTAALHRGEQVHFLPPTSTEALGGAAAVRAMALRNLRRLGPPAVQRAYAADGDPASTVYLLSTRDPFGAARICDLAGLLTVAAGPGASPYGVLVAVPTWRLVLLHVLHGPTAPLAITYMAQSAAAGAAAAPVHERISEDVYYVAPGGRTQRVAHDDGGGGILVDQRGLIGEVFFGPTGLLPG
jgi:hypothetical protein